MTGLIGITKNEKKWIEKMVQDNISTCYIFNVSWIHILLCYIYQFTWEHMMEYITGLILGLRPANERCRYKVMVAHIGWAQA